MPNAKTDSDGWVVVHGPIAKPKALQFCFSYDGALALALRHAMGANRTVAVYPAPAGVPDYSDHPIVEFKGNQFSNGSHHGIHPPADPDQP